MNCLDFRRDYLTDPYHLDSDQLAHVRECDACARFAQRQTVADRALETAMRFPVNKKLPANVIFERSLRSRRSWGMLAAAAGLVLTIAASFGVTMYWPSEQPDFSQQLVAHMTFDPQQTMPALPDANAKLTQVAAHLHFGLDPSTLDRRVVRAKLCDVDGHKGLHMVLESADGTRSTVFVMPSNSKADMVWVQARAQRGLIMPGKKGYVAVFCPETQERAQLLALTEEMGRAINWDS